MCSPDLSGEKHKPPDVRLFSFIDLPGVLTETGFAEDTAKHKIKETHHESAIKSPLESGKIRIIHPKLLGQCSVR